MSEHEQPTGPERLDNQAEPSDAEQGELPPTLRPQIYVASLSDYNDGRLHGAWLDATNEPEELGEGIARMLSTSPMPGAEEWAIHDYDDFAGVRLDEHENLETVGAIARGLQEHGPAFGAWVDICDRNREAMDDFDDAFVGHYDSLVAYADYLLEDLGYAEAMRKALPTWLLDYVRLDPDQFGQDLDASGQVYTAQAPDGGIWIFDSNYVT